MRQNNTSGSTPNDPRPRAFAPVDLRSELDVLDPARCADLWWCADCEGGAVRTDTLTAALREARRKPPALPDDRLCDDLPIQMKERDDD